MDFDADAQLGAGDDRTDTGDDDLLVTRIVQLSDTHLSAAEPVPAFWSEFAEWIAAEPPAAVVVSGDIVLIDPDNGADRTFARELFATLGVPVLVIPGNHDVGFYPSGTADDASDERLAAFTDTWAADTFTCDLPGWRLIGANAYRLGTADHDTWLRSAVAAAPAPSVAVFVHQPPSGDRQDDGWQMPGEQGEAFEAAVGHRSVKIVASGHRHSYVVRHDRDRMNVWCPSTRFTGDPAGLPPDASTASVDPGFLEYRFVSDGRFEIAQYGLTL